jgi:hypothetical protein
MPSDEHPSSTHSEFCSREATIAIFALPLAPIGAVRS